MYFQWLMSLAMLASAVVPARMPAPVGAISQGDDHYVIDAGACPGLRFLRWYLPMSAISEGLIAPRNGKSSSGPPAGAVFFHPEGSLLWDTLTRALICRKWASNRRRDAVRLASQPFPQGGRSWRASLSVRQPPHAHNVEPVAAHLEQTALCL